MPKIYNHLWLNLITSALNAKPKTIAVSGPISESWAVVPIGTWNDFEISTRTTEKKAPTVYDRNQLKRTVGIRRLRFKLLIFFDGPIEESEVVMRQSKCRSSENYLDNFAQIFRKAKNFHKTSFWKISCYIQLILIICWFTLFFSMLALPPRTRSFPMVS